MEDDSGPDAKKFSSPDSTSSGGGVPPANMSQAMAQAAAVAARIAATAGNTVEEQIRYPDNMIGMMMARGVNDKVSQIQAETGCKVQMSNESGLYAQRYPFFINFSLSKLFRECLKKYNRPDVYLARFSGSSHEGSGDGAANGQPERRGIGRCAVNGDDSTTRSEWLPSVPGNHGARTESRTCDRERWRDDKDVAGEDGS